jgi:hypothetical protein
MEYGFAGVVYGQGWGATAVGVLVKPELIPAGSMVPAAPDMEAAATDVAALKQLTGLWWWLGGTTDQKGFVPKGLGTLVAQLL